MDTGSEGQLGGHARFVNKDVAGKSRSAEAIRRLGERAEQEAVSRVEFGRAAQSITIRSE